LRVRRLALIAALFPGSPPSYCMDDSFMLLCLKAISP